jgi:hypothetical protein
MKFSEERIGKLALQIHDRLYLDNDVNYTDEEKALMVIKKVMTDFFHMEETIDEEVTRKILSLKKGILPGTSEWTVLYQKYFEEEMVKHKL